MFHVFYVAAFAQFNMHSTSILTPVLPPRPRSNFKIDKKNNINTDFDLETINTRITKPLLIICKKKLLLVKKNSYNMPICLTIKSTIEDDIEEEAHEGNFNFLIMVNWS